MADNCGGESGCLQWRHLPDGSVKLWSSRKPGETITVARSEWADFLLQAATYPWRLDTENSRP